MICLDDTKCFKGYIIEYTNKYDTKKVKKAIIVDLYTKYKHLPETSKYIKLKSFYNNQYWEISTLTNNILAVYKPKKRRSNFRILVDKFLSKHEKS